MKFYQKQISGFFLIEVLVVLGIASVILLGTLTILSVSTQSSQIVKSSFSEKDLRIALGRVLGNQPQCEANLTPNGKLEGTDKLLGIGTVSSLSDNGMKFVETSKPFKSDLEIIKMELIGDNTQDPKVSAVERTFVVYYKKQIMGKQSTLGGETCDTSDTRGCYFSQCKLKYKLNTSNDVETCDTLDCTGVADTISCYTVDDIDEPNAPGPGLGGKARTLVGCGGTSDIERSTITAFGFGAGASNNLDGVLNTYIGYKAGNQNVEGDYNTFIGYEAGMNNKGINVLQANTFIGHKAGYNTTEGGSNVFLGGEAGYESKEDSSGNTFLGYRAGYGLQKGYDNVYVGYQAGYSHDGTNPTTLLGSGEWSKIRNNTFIGYQAGYHLTTGKYNTFIGHQAGQHNTEGEANIYIGQSAGPLTGAPADISKTGDWQMNIGHLILGRIPNPKINPLQNSPNIPGRYTPPGVVINGDLKVKGNIEYNCHPSPCVSLPPIPSSKVYKKNIKPFKNFEKALDDIINTPLFTYEYKKDHPKKSRMGIISEELPEHLQIKDLDSGLRRNDKSSRNDGAKGKSSVKKKPSMPDWPSIYGTFWASIKALFIKFTDFKKTVLNELKIIKEQFTETVKEVEGNKIVIGSLNKQISSTVQISNINKEESDKRNKELKEVKALLKKTKEELKINKQVLKEIKDMIQKNKH